MKRALLVGGLIAAMLVAPISALAQDPGTGGPVVEGNIGGSANMGTFNPLRCGDTACARVWGLMFPTVIGASPETQFYARVGEPGVTQALATDWTFSEDGLTLTVNLREDALWSDGTPITANDVLFAFEAIRSGVAETQLYTGTVDYNAESNPNGIQEVRIIDDYTVEFQFGGASCTALGKAGYPVIPSHVFGWTPEDAATFDYSVLVENEFDLAPSVTSGFFTWGTFNPGESVAVQADTNYYEGATIPQGYIYRDVPDQTVQVEQFKAGELNLLDNPGVAAREDLRSNPDIVTYAYPGNAWDFLGLNHANPDNPQPGVDANGVVEQDPHPIFADVRVRRAIQHAINVPDIIEGAVFGEGQQMASAMIPSSWALDETLEPIAYDPEMAAQLLDEAGWVLGEDGVRVCQGCMYAEEGTPFEFDLITNQGNTRREAIGVLVQDQLSELGITVNYQAIDFDTLIEQVYNTQEFDAYILGWREGFPNDPDQTQLFGTASDDPANGGSNAVSYHNEQINDLMAQADAVPGCAPEERAAIYAEIQRILQEDQAYVFLYAIDGMYAARTDVEGFDPRPNLPLWNVETWSIPAAE